MGVRKRNDHNHRRCTLEYRFLHCIRPWSVTDCGARYSLRQVKSATTLSRRNLVIRHVPLPANSVGIYRCGRSLLLVVFTLGVGEKAAAVCAILLAGFVFFSQVELGDWLPFYYKPSYFLSEQVKSFDQWAIGAYGLLFSPSRGLFVYQPFLILTVVGTILFARRLAEQPVFWLVSGWLVLNLLLISRWEVWWGGGGYGSRLMVESLPGWVVLTAMVGQALRETRNVILLRAVTIGIVALSAFAIFVHYLPRDSIAALLLIGTSRVLAGLHIMLLTGNIRSSFLAEE